MDDKDKARLPIKVVFPQKKDYYRPAASGSKAKVFEPFDHETRDILVSQLHQINQYFAKTVRFM